jgi:hypothetical protein
VKVLLDENIPHDLRPHLEQHETYTVAYLGWAGLRNGRLLDIAEANGFEVLVTGDLSMSYQQNLTGMRIAIVSLSAIGWPIIEPHVAKIAKAVDDEKRGSFVRVECGALIVISGLEEIDLVISDAIDQSVFLSNASRPTTRQNVFQRFGFTQAFERIAHYCVDKIKDSDGDAALVFDPEPQVLNKFGLKYGDPFRPLHQASLFAPRL